MTELHPQICNWKPYFVVILFLLLRESEGHENLDIIIANPASGNRHSPAKMCWYCGADFEAGSGSPVFRRGEDMEEQHRGEDDGVMDHRRQERD